MLNTIKLIEVSQLLSTCLKYLYTAPGLDGIASILIYSIVLMLVS